MAWISRQPLFHLSSYAMVAQGKAKDISDLTPVFEETPAMCYVSFPPRKIY